MDTSTNNLRPSLQITLAYFFLYSFHLAFQSFTKIHLYRRQKQSSKGENKKKHRSFKEIKYYSHDNLALAGDRAVGNFHEQALLFLPLFWLHALFVEGGGQANWSLGLVYVGTRALYPLLYSLNGMLVPIATVPNYIILMIFMKNLWAAVGAM